MSLIFKSDKLEDLTKIIPSIIFIILIFVAIGAFVAAILPINKKEMANEKEKENLDTNTNKVLVKENSSISKREKLETHDMEISESLVKSAEKPKIEEKPKKPCPKCGIGNGLNAKRCFNCGAELENED